MDQNVPVDFLKGVAARVSESKDQVIKAVEDDLVKEEVDKAVGIVSKAILVAKQQQSELNKLHPDNKAFQPDPEKSGEFIEVKTFSAAKFEERKKHLEKMEKLTQAITAFFTTEPNKYKENLQKLEDTIAKVSKKD